MALIVGEDELRDIRAGLGLADYYGQSNKKFDREMSRKWVSHVLRQVDSILHDGSINSGGNQ